MRSILPAFLVASLTLGACGVVRDSALNPGNWFGRSTPAPVSAETEPVNPLIPTRSGLFGSRPDNKEIYLGEPFYEIVDLTIERVAGGAIIRATGRAERQGIFAVQLTPVTEDETPVDGTLSYRLEGVERTQPTPVGAPATREVTAARRITDQQLAGVRAIRVEGAQNARVARR
ncbi:hypothetical protein ABMC89_04670 [Sulfitobacter sp. HNIBRBA3233]|uniref:hypothetical protein n=1 Tax=Sulfitobacter marinivivus TaxID=3158558 RepID=UPI0032DEC15D